MSSELQDLGLFVILWKMTGVWKCFCVKKLKSFIVIKKLFIKIRWRKESMCVCVCVYVYWSRGKKNDVKNFKIIMCESKSCIVYND